MNILKRQSVAILITIATVLLSTLYLIMSTYPVYSVTNKQQIEEPADMGFSGTLEYNDVTQEEFVLFIREESQWLAENYEGKVTIIPTALAAIAPSLNTFMPAPTAIYTTPASENGFGETYMFTEGRVEGWERHEGWTGFVVSNSNGNLFLTIAEPLVDKSVTDYFDLLPVGTYVRVYFKYFGISEVIGYATGPAIGFTVQDLEGVSSGEIGGINAEKFARLEIGMSIEEIKSIVGVSPDSVTSSEFFGVVSDMLMWMGPNLSSITVTFTDGEATSLSQMGL